MYRGTSGNNVDLTPFIRIVPPFLAGYYLSYVYRAVNAVLGPSLAAEFGISAAELGLLTGMYFFAVGLFQIPLGVLLDRFGPRRVNGSLLLAAAAGAVLFSMAQSFGELLLARALIGLGVSACLMATVQAFVLWFPAQRMSTMIALAYSMGGLGALSVSAPLELALRWFHWREIFHALAGATLALSAVLLLLTPEHAQRKPATVGAQLAGLAQIARDPAYWRVALAIGSTQCAVVALFTLWITAWLRDVAGFSAAAAAQSLAVVCLALIAGYFFFGRLADLFARRGRAQLPLFAAGIGGSLVCLALLAAGVTTGAVLIWALFVFFGTAATLAHSILTRRYPREMTGRVNTMLNTFTFVGIFIGQWGTGAILNLWPPTPSGYDARGYPYALGALWLIQLAGLAWLWSGRILVEKKEPVTSAP